LDASAVHPEAYPLVRNILAETGKPITALIGDSATLRRLDPARFTDDRFGLPTVKDILSELEKPGRDPRPEFKTAQFKEGVETIKDLKPDMILEGTVTNVTNFGAFVDVGVHQDGLVHISALADRFVKDPHAVVKSGDLVKVKVMEVDLVRKRIALSMRLGDVAPERAVADAGEARNSGRDKRQHTPRTSASPAAVRSTTDTRRPPRPQERAKPEAPVSGGGAMADAFAKAKRR
jgi:uncharacterized protein